MFFEFLTKNIAHRSDVSHARFSKHRTSQSQPTGPKKHRIATSPKGKSAALNPTIVIFYFKKAFCKNGLVALDLRYKTVLNDCHRSYQPKSLALIKKGDKRVSKLLFLVNGADHFQHLKIG